MSYSPELIRNAHKHSSKHRAQVLAGKCGCFDCLTVFEGALVKEWIDNG